jgi:ATP-binding cassette subfamily B protein
MEKSENNMLTEALSAVRPVFFAMGAFSFFINLLLLILPLYSLQVLDRVLSTGSMDTLFWLSAIMIAVFLAASVLQALRSFALIRVGEWMDDKLGPSLLSSSLTFAAATGKRGTQNLRDLNALRGFLTGQGLLTLLDAPWSVISLAVLFIIHMQLGMITLLGCLLMVGLAWLNEVAIHKPLDEANEANVRNFQQLDIAMRNAEVIEAMGMTGTITAFWRKSNLRMTALQSLASGRSAIMQAVTRFFRLSLQIAITGWGAYLALHNEITSGSIIAASILAGRALSPFDMAIGIWKSLIEARESYDRLQKSLAGMGARPTGISLPAPKGQLTVENLVFGIQGRNRPILRGINFNLDAGEVLGIVGPSAAGKSTLAKLIVGTCKPQLGAVRLDGGDVRHWRREEFGRYVGYLPQDVELFAGPVRDNIARMDEDAPDAAIVKAAQTAFAHDMVMGLPNGYDTDIGSGGAALSAGQRQRVGLARAFFSDPKLLVLDEPDANLDTEGEQALAHAIVRAKADNVTTLVITHRSTLLQHVDKLLVLKDGEMTMFGPRHEVIMALMHNENKLRQQGLGAPPSANSAEAPFAKGENHAMA